MHDHEYLPLQSVLKPIALAQSSTRAPSTIDLRARAASVMTEFLEIPTATVDAQTPLPRALQLLTDQRVTLLLVVGHQQTPIGTITVSDIRGEKPMHFMRSLDCNHRTCAWGDITVSDIMEPPGDWQVVSMDAIEDACVSDVIQTLNVLGRRHLLVVEDSSDRRTTVLRGFFSAARLARHLDVGIDAEHPPRSFAEIERVVARI